MSVTEVLVLFGGLGVVQVILTMWLKARLESSIKSEYDTKLEELRFEIRQREQAAMVAELLAEWASRPKDVRRLNQLTWEAGLWLPGPVARELMRTLAHKSGAKTTKEILLEIRRVLKGGSDELVAADIVHFNPPAT